MKTPCPTCLQFPDFVPSSTTQKLYLNAAQNVTVNCPDGSTPTVAIPAGVVGYLLNFELGTPPYPDITLNCISGQVVVPVPDNTNQAELDKLINGALTQCAEQIGLQLGCKSGEFVNTEQTVTCPLSLFVNIAGALPVGVSVSFDGHSLIASSGLISSTISVQDSNLKATQLLNELIATGNAVCAARVPPTPSPDLLWYKFPEGSGFVSVDFSPANNECENIQGWTTGPDGDGAITFTGGSTNAVNPSTWAAGDFSYSMWVNPTGSPSASSFYAMIEMTDFALTQYCMGFYINSSNHLEFMGTYPTALATHGTVTPGSWQMVSLTFSRSTGVISIYVNGVLAGTSTTSSTFNDGSIYLSGNGIGSRPVVLMGAMADYRVWSIELSATDIMNIFLAGAQ